MRVPLIILAIFLFKLSSASEIIPFIEIKTAEDWKKAVALAKQENKLLFVDAYADWCAYCHQLDKEVYTDPEVIAYFTQSFINVKFDTESGHGILLAEEFGVVSLPTLFFLSPDESVFQTIEGFVPAPTLLAYGTQSLDDFTKLPALEEKYDNLLTSKEENIELIRILETKNYEKAVAIAKSHLDLLNVDDYTQNIENLWLASRFENQVNSVPYSYIKSHKSEIMAAHGEEEYKDYFKTVYNDNLELAIKYGEEKLLNQLVKDVIPEFLPEFEIAEASFITKKLYFGQREEVEKYKFEVQAYLNNQVSAEGRIDFLFNNALEIIENSENEALREFSAELLTNATLEDSTHFEATALLGYVKGLLGEFSVAIETLNKSKMLAQTAEQKEMAENLLAAVEEMRKD
uniref:thioredoxin family protein n=1 Tax=Roseivirga sp. TaxID=1964215 RepID=UPI0040482968